MKTQKLRFKKRPKSGAPVNVETMRGGCWHFAVGIDRENGGNRSPLLFLEGPFVILGKPSRDKKVYGFWKINAKKEGRHERYVFSVIYLSDYGVLPHKHPHSLGRTFRYAEKVWSFYKDLVNRQDLEAYKEAIKATL